MSSKGPRVELIITHPPDPAADVLEEIGGRARNARPVMQQIIAHLTEVERQEFATGGAYAGDPWKQKKDSTIARQKREGFGDRRPMHFKGDLEESLTSAKGGKGAIRRSSKQAATFGTRLYYAGFQDVAVINVTAADKNWMAEAISNWLLHGDAA